MAAALQSRNPTIEEAVGKLLSRRGKMLRPGFVLLSARMRPVNGNVPVRAKAPLPEKIYQIAAAVEIMHLATLVHDDIIDRAEIRRGAPSLNADFGNRNAVLLGDFLFSRCFILVARHASTANARYLATAVSHICDSEIAQSRRFDPASLSVRDYMRRITGKTALLFSLSCHIGASENEAPQGIVAPLRRVGHNVGLAFQIVDDLLDFTGDEKTLGKPAGGDLREGIFTLPVIHAYRKNPVALGPLLTSRALEREKNAEKILNLIEATGGFAETRKTAGLFTARALREAEKLPSSENRRSLIHLVEALPTRSF